MSNFHPDAFSSGISLRDWFAGQALAGIVEDGLKYGPTNTAAQAYHFADAMMKERQSEDT